MSAVWKSASDGLFDPNRHDVGGHIEIGTVPANRTGYRIAKGHETECIQGYLNLRTRSNKQGAGAFLFTQPGEAKLE